MSLLESPGVFFWLAENADNPRAGIGQILSYAGLTVGIAFLAFYSLPQKIRLRSRDR